MKASILCLAGLLLLPHAHAQQRAVTERPQPPNPYLPVADVPGLPRVLLIGDSISEGYTVPVRKLLEGKANVHRIPENGGPARLAGTKIDRWLGQEKWDVIHFNWGLHDVMVFPNPKKDLAQDEQDRITEYEASLRTLVARLKQTGARLIWASSTPVADEMSSPRSPSHRAEFVAKYNAVAAKVIQENNIPVDDLNTWVTPVQDTMRKPHDVHFRTEGYDYLAKQVAASIEKVLPEKK